MRVSACPPTAHLVPRVAAVHDLSGFGRTSLTVVIPILSSMGAQVCPLPTAILSTHTVEFTDFTLLDLTDEMARILDHWETLGLTFDAVYSGFMASSAQMAHVARCIRTCLAPGGIAVVDPVLGDNGVLDTTMTPDMVIAMRDLVKHADVTTPNFTELAFLLDEAVPTRIDTRTLKRWLIRLAELGPKRVVVTSAPISPEPEHTAVVAYDKVQERFWHCHCPYIPAHYPGTGDTFASVLTGALLQGDALPVAIERAVHFVTLGIKATFGHALPTREGIVLERVLPFLHTPPTTSPCTLLR